MYMHVDSLSSCSSLLRTLSFSENTASRLASRLRTSRFSSSTFPCKVCKIKDKCLKMRTGLTFTLRHRIKPMSSLGLRTKPVQGFAGERGNYFATLQGTLIGFLSQICCSHCCGVSRRIHTEQCALVQCMWLL